MIGNSHKILYFAVKHLKNRAFNYFNIFLIFHLNNCDKLHNKSTNLSFGLQFLLGFADSLSFTDAVRYSCICAMLPKCNEHWGRGLKIHEKWK